MTFSTLLTFLRIALTGVILFLVPSSDAGARFAALVVFVIAGLTDWLDGFLARRWHQTSDIGTLLDPIADKVLVLGVLGVLAYQRVVPGWIFIIMAAREVSITLVRLVAASRNLVLAAAPEGKLKTVAQMLSLFLFLLAGGWQAAIGADAPSRGIALMYQAALFSLITAMVLTLFSGFSFFQRNGKALRMVLKR